MELNAFYAEWTAASRSCRISTEIALNISFSNFYNFYLVILSNNFQYFSIHLRKSHLRVVGRFGRYLSGQPRKKQLEMHLDGAFGFLLSGNLYEMKLEKWVGSFILIDLLHLG